MSDPCAVKLADLLVTYSLGLGEGETVRIDAGVVAAPLVRAVHLAALRAGANPLTHVSLPGLQEQLLVEGSDDQVAFVAETDHHSIDYVDAVVTIWSEENTRSLAGVTPDRVQRRLAARQPLSKRLWERIDAGEARWVGTRFPTNAHAQDAEMSLDGYERFVYGACHVLDDEDPIAYWQGTSDALEARARELETVSELRIVGPDTDLRVGVAGRSWQAADGKLNMPDGEIFTSPQETETDGEIRFTFPAVFSGRGVEDVRLRFEAGRVVHAEASSGEDYLRSLLDMDDGARTLGEVAFGLNYEIDRFTRDILFDEKIGGTVHLALGSSFKKLGGVNESGLHWDMICDLREEGEIYADGELVWRAGSFLREPQTAGAAVRLLS